MLKGFKDFITRGNVIELAVGVIIAGAFGPVVQAVTDVIMGFIASIFGAPNFDEALNVVVNGTTIAFGPILTALVNFLLVAFAIYFFIVVPMNKLAERRKVEEEEARPEDVVLLEEIKDLLKAQRA
ncbi:MAG TPA: large conductance mechanosensitive channel protein MscL [Actinomycetales bacterium]|nr:large conductance mechanosensitive channel protein MscL [Actinomycetales bacterium]